MMKENTLKKALVIGVVALAFGLFAGPFDTAVLHGETDKECAIDYAPNEEMTFTISLDGATEFPPDSYFIKWTIQGDDGMKKRSGKEPASLTKPLVLKTSLSKPGFVKVSAYLVDAKGKNVHRAEKPDGKSGDGKKYANRYGLKAKEVFFEGGAGVQVDTLQGVPEPADFRKFWEQEKAKLAAVPFKDAVKLVEKPPRDAHARIFAVEIPCAGPRPVTGYLTVPTKAGKYPAKFAVDGYNGKISQSQQAPAGAPWEQVTLHINAHGYDLDRDRDYYDQYAKSIMSHGKTYALAAEEHPEPTGCYFEGMVLRVLRGLEYLKSRPEWNGRDLLVIGGSQGGLQTMWAAGLDADVSEAKPSIPWCCDMGGNATMGRVKKNWGVAWTPAMGYYDPINMARHVSSKCRVEIVRAGLGDYTCPPSGVAILYNNLKCPKKINWVQGSTHIYVPPEEHQQFSLSEGW